MNALPNPEKKVPSAFTKPQKRRPRIRRNKGAWNPLVDLTEIFPGNRGVNRQGMYELYDGPLGVEVRVEQARRSEALLEATAEWEQGGSISPLFIWETDGLQHMIYQCSRVEGTCYSTSVDGYDWERPELGQVEFKGST